MPYPHDVRAESSVTSGAAKKTILLVEDEKIVRNLLQEVLQRAGYEVLACSNPEAGIETCRQYPGHIHLLLTDVVMPGMNGKEMADQIAQIVPGICVVFMSGYTEHVMLEEGQPDQRFEYLQKPFSLQVLLRKLEDLLGRGGGPPASK